MIRIVSGRRNNLSLMQPWHEATQTTYLSVKVKLAPVHFPSPALRSFSCFQVLYRQGWVDLGSGEFPGWWAASVATYCLIRLAEHLNQVNTAQLQDQLAQFSVHRKQGVGRDTEMRGKGGGDMTQPRSQLRNSIASRVDELIGKLQQRRSVRVEGSLSSTQNPR